MPKIQRSVSVEIGEWAEWVNDAKNRDISVSELIRNAVRNYNGDDTTTIPEGIRHEATHLKDEVSALLNTLERLTGHINNHDVKKTEIVNRAKEAEQIADKEEQRKADLREAFYNDLYAKVIETGDPPHWNQDPDEYLADPSIHGFDTPEDMKQVISQVEMETTEHWYEEVDMVELAKEAIRRNVK